jgi:hypothetical protein
MIKDKSYSPIFVTGVERSGSSLIGRIITMCGGFSGKITPMSENIRIKKLVDDYYKTFKADTRGQFPLPNTNELLIPRDWKDKVNSILTEEGYTDSKVWMSKGSRMAQIWPVWNFAYPDAKWIVVRRRTGDVIQSCLKTGFMDAFGDRTIQQIIGVDNEKDGWLWWIHEHEKLFVQMIESGLNVKQIWPERMLNGDFRQIQEMLDWVGLPWNEGIITLLDETLIKSKNNGRKSNSNRG